MLVDTIRTKRTKELKPNVFTYFPQLYTTLLAYHITTLRTK